MKDTKRKIKYFIIISIILIGILPIINFDKYISSHDLKKLFNTDKIEMYVNYAFYKIFNRSLEENKVIVGKDDFLFLGNQYAQVLHKTQGLYKYNEKGIENWVNKLKNIQTLYEARGIKFLIVIAPNKHSIYKEKLPDWMSYTGKTLTDHMVKLANEKNIHMLDLRGFLISKKSNNKLLYNKHGTHWNHYGASLGYDKTIAYINSLYNINIRKLEYEVIDDYKSADRDLMRLLKLREKFLDINENGYALNVLDKVCVGDINTFTDIGIKAGGYVVNKNSSNNQTLLIMGDSFMGANAQLYNATFKKVLRSSDAYFPRNKFSSFVEKYKPDIVIYQLVERRLYHAGIFKKLSPIYKVNYTNYTNDGNKIFDINNRKYSYDKNNELTIRNKELIVTDKDPIIILNHLKTKSKFVRLNYNLESSTKTVCDFLYKETKNSKYNGKNSYSVAIKQGNNKISLVIPSKYINNQLRVDLVSKIGKYKINDFSIYEVK